MKRTRNGILIPDVPIMAGGNLPNAVKGVSAGGGGGFDPSRPPFYIEPKTQVHIQAVEGLMMSNDGIKWVPTETTVINSRIYLAGKGTLVKPIVTKTDGEFFDIGGNILSLISIDFSEDDLERYRFNSNSFFADTNVVSAKSLIMPSKNVYCAYMFSNCSSLTEAPELPALDLRGHDYEYMFSRCTSLVTPPSILPAKKLYNSSCYNSMFVQCSKLEVSPIIAAESLLDEKTDYMGFMFMACYKLKRIVCYLSLRDETKAKDCMQAFSNAVSSTGVFVKKRGARLERGTNGIPTGWTVEEID